MEKGILTPPQVEQVVQFSKENGMRFGEAAIEMGLIRIETMIRLFGPNYRTDFFQLEAAFFPEVTKDLFSTDVLIKHGILPLGFKTEHRFFRSRKVLNLGMLNPGKATTLAQVELLAREKLGNQFHSIRPYLILGDQFFDVLHTIYKVSDESIRAKEHSEVDETVQLFLDAAVI